MDRFDQRAAFLAAVIFIFVIAMLIIGGVVLLSVGVWYTNLFAALCFMAGTYLLYDMVRFIFSS